MLKVLYICTHNRCRSILAEALTNHRAGDCILARSAGSQPAGVVHPLTLKFLAAADVPTTGLQSQSWDDFADFHPDLVITLCDSAAGEACPVWFGRALKVHWGLADPSKIPGDENAVAAAFLHTIRIIEGRVDSLRTLPGVARETWPALLRAAGAA